MCINNPKTSIITDNAEEARYLAIIADLDTRLDALAEDFKEIRAEQQEIRAEQEKDLVFFKNLNAQMDAALAQ